MEPRGSKVVKVPLGARMKPCPPPVERKKSPATTPSGLMREARVNAEKGGSNKVKVPFGARRKPCAVEKSGVVVTSPTIVPAGLMSKERLQTLGGVEGLHVAPGGSNGVMVPSEVRRKL